MVVADDTQVKMPSFGCRSITSDRNWRPKTDIPPLIFSEIENANLDGGDDDEKYSLLIGSYDLIFYSESSYIPKCRATKGSLDLFFVGNNTNFSGEQRQLGGRVALDKSVKSDIILYHQVDTVLQQRPQSSSSSSGNLTTVSKPKFEVANVARINSANVTIKISKKRQALRYLPEGDENYVAIKEHEKQYADSIRFKSLRGAQSIHDDYSNEPLLWLRNHTNLPDDVSYLIKSYASAKPPPVFFFEEGDLMLVFEWLSGFLTRIFARRRRVSYGVVDDD